MSTSPPPTPAAPQPTPPASPHHAPSHPPPGGRAARLIVVLCFAIATLATALIYWRWSNVSEPTTYVIIEGAAEHNGTVITISTEKGGEVVAMATLAPENHYAVTIFLHPGTYWFHAAHRGTTLIEGSVLMAHRRWKNVQLKTTTSPATAPGDRDRAAAVS